MSETNTEIDTIHKWFVVSFVLLAYKDFFSFVDWVKIFVKIFVKILIYIS